MLESWNQFIETSPDAAMGLALIVLIFAVVLPLLFIATRKARKAPVSPSYRTAQPSAAGAAAITDSEDEDDTIKATGIVERAVAAIWDGCSQYHLAVRLDTPLSQLHGDTMLRFSDDAGFVDLPLVHTGDRVALEFTIDEDGEVELYDFTWLPEK